MKHLKIQLADRADYACRCRYLIMMVLFCMLLALPFRKLGAP